MRGFTSRAGSLFPLLGALFPAAVVALSLSGCGDDGAGPKDPAAVRVLLTDAPSDYIESAEIWVSAVYLQGGSAAEEDLDGDGIPDGEDEEVAGRVFLFRDADNPKHFDLLDLRAGLVADLTGYSDVDPGQYGQLRLVVDSAFVTLTGAYTFEDGSATRALRVPSGSTAGIKVQLSRPLDVDEGEEVSVVVDFDVDRNFVLQGNPNSPAGIRGILFTPTLRELSRTQGG